ncbi:MAG: L-2-hydroxyglutarate oxidase [Gammaproteobacteria bacterium]|nr:L-2-hydroxyglutarate oxidase [Gammaproteobacteria bacterium]
MSRPDFLIIGGGIVGLAIAKELKNRYPDNHVTILEKEEQAGLHSSGRNSGVLHSGIYYPPSSVKAQVCVQGAREMIGYCIDRKLPLNRIGKVLTPTRKQDALQIDLLQQRALENGVFVERLDEKSLKELEPEAFSVTGEALWVPSTAVGDSAAVMQSMVSEVLHMGIELRFKSVITSVDVGARNVKMLSGDAVSYGHAINCAGLHADSVAHKFDVGHRYTLLPFKGIYWKLDPNSGLDIRHLIYPVPDLRVPFLGVHTTTMSDGSIYLGPTAVPAFGRENYYGLKNVTAPELFRISRLLMQQTIAGRDGFRALAWQEGRRYFKPWFADAARAILPRLQDNHLLPCDKVGIRAQMFDRQDKKLVNDFLVERGLSSTHILNAISPAWTSAFPFARFVIDNYIER